jgi:hypothetical protein
MTFTREKISGDDSNQVPWADLPYYKNKLEAIPQSWVIDRDKEAFFWCMHKGMPQDPTQEFGLSIKNKIYYISAVSNFIELVESGERIYDIAWEILRITAPKKNHIPQTLLREIIQDIFDVYGDLFRRPDLRNVQVIFRQKNTF